MKILVIVLIAIGLMGCSVYTTTTWAPASERGEVWLLRSDKSKTAVFLCSHEDEKPVCVQAKIKNEGDVFIDFTTTTKPQSKYYYTR